jgi:hypothetical protein
VVEDHELADSETNPLAQHQLRFWPTLDWHKAVKVKVFEVILHKLPSGKSPASALEEQLNGFLAQQPKLQVVATHMNTVVSPAEPNAMPRSEASSIIIFCTLFYTD